MNAIVTVSRQIAVRGTVNRGLVRRASARWIPSSFICAGPGGSTPEGPADQPTLSITLMGARRSASTQAQDEAPPSGGAFAAVDHSQSYEEALDGRHGEQLKMADDEGLGKDDPPYDPFEEPFFQALDQRNEEEGSYELEDSADEGGAPLGDDNLDSDEEEEDYDEDAEGTLDRVRAMYNADGSLVRPKSELAALRAGKPAGGNFAVVDLNGSQQKVTVDDVVIVNKLKPVTKWAVGNTVTLTGEEVLLLGSPQTTLVGLPGVKGAEVDVMVEEITRDAKMIVFKKRRRKHSQRKNGFRREVTFLRVLDIRFPERYSGQKGGESES